MSTGTGVIGSCEPLDVDARAWNREWCELISCLVLSSQQPQGRPKAGGSGPGTSYNDLGKRERWQGQVSEEPFTLLFQLDALMSPTQKPDILNSPQALDQPLSHGISVALSDSSLTETLLGPYLTEKGTPEPGQQKTGASRP